MYLDISNPKKNPPAAGYFHASFDLQKYSSEIEIFKFSPAAGCLIDVTIVFWIILEARLFFLIGTGIVIFFNSRVSQFHNIICFSYLNFSVFAES